MFKVLGKSPLVEMGEGCMMGQKRDDEKRRKAHLQKAGKEQLKQEDQDGGDVSAVGGWREKRADS